MRRSPILPILLTLALLLGLASLTATPARAEILHLDAGTPTLTVDQTRSDVFLTVDAGVSATLTIAQGAMLSLGNITIDNGATLTVYGPGELNVGPGIFTPIQGSALVIESGTVTVASWWDGAAVNVREVTINGGTFTVTGSNGPTEGGSRGGGGMVGHLTVNGGTVTLQGGKGADNDGSSEYWDGSGAPGLTGSLTVNGGTVTITGGDGGADALPGEHDGADGGEGIYVGYQGAVTVTGGTVTVQGGAGGAGYDRGGRGGDGISEADSMVITGGTLTATGGQGGQSGGVSDGVRNSFGGRGIDAENLTVTGGQVTATGGKGGSDGNGGCGIRCSDELALRGGAVTATGGQGGDPSDSSVGLSGDGGAGILSSSGVLYAGGTLTVTGGQGGDGGNGGTGIEGRSGPEGFLLLIGGDYSPETVQVRGGAGGQGGTAGAAGGALVVAPGCLYTDGETRYKTSLLDPQTLEGDLTALPAARVGRTEYFSLQAAMDAAGEVGTAEAPGVVTLLRDVEMMGTLFEDIPDLGSDDYDDLVDALEESASLSVDWGSRVVLDLAGFTIDFGQTDPETGAPRTLLAELTGEDGAADVRCSLSVLGDLTLRDSSGEGTGRITGANSKEGGAIDVITDNVSSPGDGTFRMEGGTLSGNYGLFGAIYSNGSEERPCAITLAGGAIQNNYGAVTGGMFFTADTTLQLSGDVRVEGNRALDPAATLGNPALEELIWIDRNVAVFQTGAGQGATITVAGALGEAARIGVSRVTSASGFSVVSEPGTFAVGTGDHALTLAESRRFTSDDPDLAVGFDPETGTAYLGEGYKVTYLPEPDGDEPLVDSAAKDSPYPLLANPFPTPAGKRFYAWQMGTEICHPGDVYLVGADTQLVALWNSVEDATVIAPTYEPIVAATDHGTVEVSPSPARKGETVTVEPAPQAGYEVDTVTVTDKDGQAVEVTKGENGTYTFVQPAGAVTVTVTFRPAVRYEDFPDLPLDAWYAPYVRWALENGVMVGDGKYFHPTREASRAEIVQILFNLSGAKTGGKLPAFADVSAEDWYAPAVTWAVSNGIAQGEGYLFGAEEPISREKLAVMLCNYAKYRGRDVTAAGDLSRFVDGDEVSDWAREAMAWAVGAGLFQGTEAGRLVPQGTVDRAQVATLMERLWILGLTG